MEQNLSILIADLSGYTALTEAHGSLSAADLIDKYIEIVDYSLVGVSRLHERVGDEVMIVSDIAHDLLLTAEKLYKNILAESNFLQVHGALHHGSLLKRKNNYFGSALNLTSRMVAQAKAGSFVCSRDFISALPHDLNKKFIPAGSHKFKNVAGSLELFEIVFDEAPGFNVDPICKMIIAKESISFRHPEKNDIFFCSQNCLDTYMAKKPGV